jgi:hypothetical protein
MTTQCSIGIQGLDNHQVSNCGCTIHSSAQLEWYQNDVNDRSLKVPGGLQHITTLDGYVHPLNIVSGLPYVTMRPYTDAKWETLPHVIWTGDIDWDPSVLDLTLDDDQNWFDAISDLKVQPFTSLFDKFGDYCTVCTLLFRMSRFLLLFRMLRFLLLLPQFFLLLP